MGQFERHYLLAAFGHRSPEASRKAAGGNLGKGPGQDKTMQQFNVMLNRRISFGVSDNGRYVFISQAVDKTDDSFRDELIGKFQVKVLSGIVQGHQPPFLQLVDNFKVQNLGDGHTI